MAIGIWVAAACLGLLGVFHSYLGERFLIGPLLASPKFPVLRLEPGFAKATLRFAWHLTTLAWWVIAYQLVRGESSPWPIVGLLSVSGLYTYAATRGRHAAWAVFMLGAVALASAAVEPVLLSRPAAVVAAVLLAAIGALHVAWAFGMRWGSISAVPERAGAPVFVPGRAITLAVAGALFIATWLVLALAELAPAPLPASWLWALGLAATCVFALRTIGDGRFVGLSKRVTGTRFARFDDALFTPLCFLLSASMVLQLL